MLVILAGKSASGKDALMQRLIKEEEFIPLLTETTRPMRDGEKEGVDYYFISKAQFDQRLKEGRYLEYRSYHTLVGGKKDTWYYASPKQELLPDKNYIKILDIDGVMEYKDFYGQDNVCVIYIDADDTLRRSRAEKRGSFDKTEWERRLLDDNEKFTSDKILKACDYVIKNNYPTTYLLKHNFDIIFDLCKGLKEAYAEEEFEEELS